MKQIKTRLEVQNALDQALDTMKAVQAGALRGDYQLSEGEFDLVVGIRSRLTALVTRITETNANQ